MKSDNIRESYWQTVKDLLGRGANEDLKIASHMIVGAIAGDVDQAMIAWSEAQAMMAWDEAQRSIDENPNTS